MIQTLSYNPTIFTISQFLSDDECDHIINTAKKQNMIRSNVSGVYGRELSEGRKSHSVWFDKNKFKNILERVSTIMQVSDPNRFENFQILRYEPGGEYKWHMDSYDMDTERGKTHTNIVGQRLFTVLIYLNSNFDGGCTSIKHNNLKIIPEKGKILVFKNTLDDNRTRDERSLHAGMPVISGEKWIVNLWLRQYSKNQTIQKSIKIIDYKKNFSEFIELNNNDNSSNVLYHPQIKMNNHSINSVLIKNTLLEFSNPYNIIKSALDNLDTNIIFDEYNPVMINDVLDCKLNKIIKNYLNECISNNKFKLGDSQSKRYKGNDEIICRCIQFILLPLIEKITKCKLKPTYTYLSSYITNSELPGHTDRAECEFTVTYLVDKTPFDVKWPIWVHTKKQNEKYRGRYPENPPYSECLQFDAYINSIVIIMGTDHIHFRDVFEGKTYTNVLCHYQKA